MKVLVLNVDRDDDFGVKAGMNSPFIGREENLEAAIALGLKDAEDCDVNTLLSALSIYDEMTKKGIDVEVATICGDPKVGFESDLALATQLENVLETIKPERVILIGPSMGRRTSHLSNGLLPCQGRFGPARLGETGSDR